MKIACPCIGTEIAQHFGHCENFYIYTAENGAVVAAENVPNPGHKPGFLPNFLADKGCTVVIAGGMGGGAVDIFNERGCEVILGASGDSKAAVEKYLRGELESTGSICHHHDHEEGEEHNCQH